MDQEILTANETYGSLGELAIMALPKSKGSTLLYTLGANITINEASNFFGLNIMFLGFKHYEDTYFLMK